MGDYFLQIALKLATTRREARKEVCGLPRERIKIFAEFTINVGAQEIEIAGPPQPPLENWPFFGQT